MDDTPTENGQVTCSACSLARAKAQNEEGATPEQARLATCSEHGDVGHSTYLTVRFDEQVKDIAHRLRGLADEVGREGIRDANKVGAPEYGWKAGRVLHAVVWGVANLNLEGLTDMASELDRYEGQAISGTS